MQFFGLLAHSTCLPSQTDLQAACCTTLRPTPTKLQMPRLVPIGVGGESAARLPPLVGMGRHMVAALPVGKDLLFSHPNRHFDNGSLTGLTSAMYLDAAGQPAACPDPGAGLHIKDRSGEGLGGVGGVGEGRQLSAPNCVLWLLRLMLLASLASSWASARQPTLASHAWLTCAPTSHLQATWCRCTSRPRTWASKWARRCRWAEGQLEW